MYENLNINKSTPTSDKVLVLEEAKKIVGVGKDYNLKHVLTCFDIEVACRIENKESDTLGDLTDNKNILVRDLIEKMIAEHGRFNLDGQIPFKYACISCHGTGELYRLFRKKEEVDCKFCNGTGNQVQRCPVCKGSGRFKREDRGLRINVECKNCRGKGQIGTKHKCRNCQGTGKFHKMVIDSIIKSTTTCKECNGRGFFDKDQYEKHRRKSEPDHPVISSVLGDQIKAAVVAKND